MQTFLLPALLLLSAPVFTQGAKCGQWYSNDCRAKDDIRYDVDFTNDILEQDPRWKYYEGFWEAELRATDGNGDAFGASIFDPMSPGSGLPYNRTLYRGYYNHTFVGSRMETSRYYIFPAPDPSFCETPIVPPQMNVLGAGTCGVNGLLQPAGFYGTASFEKDGSISSFGPFGVYGGQGNSTVTEEMFRFVDDNTLYSFAGGGNGFSSSTVLVFLDEDKTRASITQNFYTTGTSGQLVLSVHIFLVKFADEAQFIAAVDAGYDEFNILPSERLPVPAKDLSLDPDSYPSEETWCRFDPECGVSPYQEPDGTVKGGVVAGFIVAFFVIVIAILFLVHRQLMKQQLQRNRKAFVARIASTVNLRASTNVLTPEGLVKEFHAIDGELGKGDSDGAISKDELWEFMSSGKAGEMEENDFNALFSAIDTDNSGKVDFLEFCAFLGECSGELEDAAKARSAKARAIAGRLSMRAAE